MGTGESGRGQDRLSVLFQRSIVELLIYTPSFSSIFELLGAFLQPLYALDFIGCGVASRHGVSQAAGIWHYEHPDRLSDSDLITY